MKKSTIFFLVLCFCNLFTAQAQWDSIATFDQVIFDLKAHDSKLFIAGGFTEMNYGQTCYWSAYYDGSAIARHTDMIGGSGIRRLETFNGELYGVGGLNFFQSIGVGVWDGSTWNNGGSTNYSHSLVCAVGNNLYVSDDDNKMRKQTGSGNFQSFYDFLGNDEVNALFNYNGDLLVAGEFDTVGGVPAKNIAMWNGSTWQALGSGISTGARCMAIYNGELYVAGEITLAGSTTVADIAKWNGTTWSAVGQGVTGNNYNGIRDMIVFGGKLIVVGDMDEMGGVNTGNVAAWNGSQWSSMGLQHNESFVQCAEVFNNELYVGTFDFNHAHVFKYEGAVGIKENEIQSVVKVYPNPFTNQFTVEVADDSEVTVTIYDMLGCKLSQQSFEKYTVMNMQQYESGIYFYELRNNAGNVITDKIIKQ